MPSMLACYNMHMRNSRSNQPLDKIDTEMFFRLLAGKLDDGQIEVVTAAMAESVGRGGVSRVLDCAAEPKKKIAAQRKRLRRKLNSSVKG